MHRERVREAPTTGYFDTDLSDAVRIARGKAEAGWRYRQLERHRRRETRPARERFRREGGTIRTPEGFEFEIPPAP